jgi:hypothetical protein
VEPSAPVEALTRVASVEPAEWPEEKLEKAMEA